MTYFIIGTGNAGKALARQFARSDIAIGIANTHGPESIAAMAKEIGEKVAPLTLQEALMADVIILAISFWSHRDLDSAFCRRTLDSHPRERVRIWGWTYFQPGSADESLNLNSTGEIA